MAHDSRRYHRTRRPTFARAYGMLGAIGSGLATAGSAVGSGLESAAGAVGSGLESAASSLLGGGGEAAAGGAGAAVPAAGAAPSLASVGNFLVNRATGGAAKGATSALGSLGQGLQSLFGTGAAENIGPGFVGPPAPVGPGFLGGFAQGFMGDVPNLAHPSAGTSMGQGLGQLTDMLEKLNAQSPPPPPLPMQPIIQTGGPVRPLQVIPGGSAQPGTGPIMKLLGIL
jgi:hypothetical protein